MGADVRDALVQEWRRYLRVKQAYPLLKSNAERGVFFYFWYSFGDSTIMPRLHEPTIHQKATEHERRTKLLGCTKTHLCPVSFIAEEHC